MVKDMKQGNKLMTRTRQDLKDDMDAFDNLPRAIRDLVNTSRYSFPISQLVEQLDTIRKIAPDDVAVPFMVKYMVEAERVFVAPVVAI